MARHPWVAEADDGIRWGVQLIVPDAPGAIRELVETARRVEALGYDYLSIFDHPLLHVEPWIALSGIATATNRIRLGSTVNCARYRHPMHLARLAADLDNLSGGRHILGLGSGWLAREYAALGLDFGTLKERQASLEDTLAITTRLLEGETVDYAGDVFSTTGAVVTPRPTQTPRPPILVGGSGEKVTLRQVARWADACNVKEDESLADDAILDTMRAVGVRRKLDALDGHLDALGRPRDEVLRTHFTLYLLLAPTQQAADAKMAALDTSTSTSPGTRREGRNSMLVASVDRAVGYYQAMVDAGIDYFVVQLDGTDAETIELLATEVTPRVVPSAK